MEMKLDEALYRALVTNGPDVFADEKRVASFVMDLCDCDERDVAVFLRNCDDELLKPLREALQAPSADAARMATLKVRELLVHDRGMDEDLATRIASALGNAVARYGVLPKPEVEAAEHASVASQPTVQAPTVSKAAVPQDRVTEVSYRAPDVPVGFEAPTPPDVPAIPEPTPVPDTLAAPRPQSAQRTVTQPSPTPHAAATSKAKRRPWVAVLAGIAVMVLMGTAVFTGMRHANNADFQTTYEQFFGAVDDASEAAEPASVDESEADAAALAEAEANGDSASDEAQTSGAHEFELLNKKRRAAAPEAPKIVEENVLRSQDDGVDTLTDIITVENEVDFAIDVAGQIDFLDDAGNVLKTTYVSDMSVGAGEQTYLWASCSDPDATQARASVVGAVSNENYLPLSELGIEGGTWNYFQGTLTVSGRNWGDCPAYIDGISVVHVTDGEGWGASYQELSELVQPGDTFEVSVSLEGWPEQPNLRFKLHGFGDALMER